MTDKTNIARWLPLAVLGVVLALAAGAWAGEGDDWAGDLSGGSDDSAQEPVDTGVVGMSEEDLEEYRQEELAVADDEVPEDFLRQRRRLVLRELKINSDWDCDPTALPSLMDQLRRRTGMDGLALQPRRPLTLDDPDLLNWPLVFVTAHYAFTLTEAEVKGLRKWADRGGFLFADDCLYGQTFGQCFPGEIRKAYPEKEFITLKPDTPGFSLLLKQKYSWDRTNEAGLPTVIQPNPFSFFEINGHIGMLYTPPDLGCSWEISSPPTPANPLGGAMHSGYPNVREACFRIGINVLLYALLH